MDGMNMGGMMMQMYFEAGTNVTILIESWKTTDAWSLFGSVVSYIVFDTTIKLFKSIPT